MAAASRSLYKGIMRSMLLIVALCATSLPTAWACTQRPAASAPRTYESRGTLKSFGPDRKYANIHHEDIPGYMNAMTMSFEAGEPGQLDALREGQRVSFAFSDDDGRRILLRIRPE